MSGGTRPPVLVDFETAQLLTQRTGLLHSCGPIGAPHGWMVLHGLSDRSANFIDTWRRLEHANSRRVLAPEGLSRHILDPVNDVTGACWGTVEDRPIDQRDAFAWLDLCFGRLQEEAGAGARVLVGFSQGSLIAARWAVARPFVWDAVVLWGAAVPTNVDPRELCMRSKSQKIHIVLGQRDRFATAERRKAVTERLRSVDVPVQMLEFDGGHRMDDRALAEVAARFER